jgi:hypothetical protein
MRIWSVISVLVPTAHTGICAWASQRPTHGGGSPCCRTGRTPENPSLGTTRRDIVGQLERANKCLVLTLSATSAFLAVARRRIEWILIDDLVAITALLLAVCPLPLGVAAAGIFSVNTTMIGSRRCVRTFCPADRGHGRRSLIGWSAEPLAIYPANDRHVEGLPNLGCSHISQAVASRATSRAVSPAFARPRVC